MTGSRPRSAADCARAPTSPSSSSAGKIVASGPRLISEYSICRSTIGWTAWARRIVSTTGRHQFYTVRIADSAAVPAFKASGDITSMSQADGYIEIPAQVDIVEAGELVDVKLF